MRLLCLTHSKAAAHRLPVLLRWAALGGYLHQGNLELGHFGFQSSCSMHGFEDMYFPSLMSWLYSTLCSLNADDLDACDILHWSLYGSDSLTLLNSSKLRAEQRN